MLSPALNYRFRELFVGLEISFISPILQSKFFFDRLVFTDG